MSILKLTLISCRKWFQFYFNTFLLHFYYYFKESRETQTLYAHKWLDLSPAIWPQFLLAAHYSIFSSLGLLKIYLIVKNYMTTHIIAAFTSMTKLCYNDFFCKEKSTCLQFSSEKKAT